MGPNPVDPNPVGLRDLWDLWVQSDLLVLCLSVPWAQYLMGLWAQVPRLRSARPVLWRRLRGLWAPLGQVN